MFCCTLSLIAPLRINLSNSTGSFIIFAIIASLYLRCTATLLILPSVFVYRFFCAGVSFSKKFLAFTPCPILFASFEACLACALAFGSPCSSLCLSFMVLFSLRRSKRFFRVLTCTFNVVSCSVSASTPSF